MRIYGRKEARRRSFLGNEAISDSSRDHFCATVHDQYIPAAYTHWSAIVRPLPCCSPSTLSFSRVSVCAVRHASRPVGRPTRETHGNPAIFPSTISPFIVIHAFYGPCYIDRPANNRDTLYSATRRLTTDRAEYRSL